MKSTRAPRLGRISRSAVVGFLLCAAPQAGFANEGVVSIGGTGMALAAMQQVGESLTAADPSMRVEMLPSLGTPGGLRALAERAIDIAVIGRSLNAEERARGV